MPGADPTRAITKPPTRNAATPPDGALRSDELARVRAAFGALDTDDQELLDLRIIGGLDSDGVAEALGRRPRIVRTLQTSALDRLRTAFEEPSEMEQSSAN